MEKFLLIAVAVYLIQVFAIVSADNGWSAWRCEPCGVDFPGGKCYQPCYRDCVNVIESTTCNGNRNEDRDCPLTDPLCGSVPTATASITIAKTTATASTKPFSTTLSPTTTTTTTQPPTTTTKTPTTTLPATTTTTTTQLPTTTTKPPTTTLPPTTTTTTTQPPTTTTKPSTKTPTTPAPTEPPLACARCFAAANQNGIWWRSCRTDRSECSKRSGGIHGMYPAHGWFFLHCGADAAWCKPCGAISLVYNPRCGRCDYSRDASC